jgi:hypothetical protein
MVQHTVIHEFAGAYGYYVWMLIVAVFFFELRGAFHPARARLAFLVLALPLAYWALDRHYARSFKRYVRNIVAGEVVSPRPPAAKKARDVDRTAEEAADRAEARRAAAERAARQAARKKARQKRKKRRRPVTTGEKL